jgi:hypothetical protein
MEYKRPTHLLLSSHLALPTHLPKACISSCTHYTKISKTKKEIRKVPATQREERLRERKGWCCDSRGMELKTKKTTAKNLGSLPIDPLAGPEIRDDCTYCKTELSVRVFEWYVLQCSVV